MIDLIGTHMWVQMVRFPCTGFGRRGCTTVHEEGSVIYDPE